MKDLAADRVHIVVAPDILVDELHRLDDLAREAELQMLEARQADAAAEIDDAALAHPDRFGKFGDRHADDLFGLRQDMVGDAPRAARHSAMSHSHSFERIFDRRPIVPRRFRRPARVIHFTQFSVRIRMSAPAGQRRLAEIAAI